MHPEPQRVVSRERPVSPGLAAAISLAVVVGAPLLLVRGEWRALAPSQPSAAAVKLQVWLVLVSAQAFCWTLLLRWMMPRLVQLVRTIGGRATLLHAAAPTLLLSLAGIGIWAAGVSGGQVPETIANYRIVRYAGPVGFLVASIGVFGVFLEYWSTIVDSAAGSATERVLRLGKGLAGIHQFLFSSAVVLGLGTIGTSAHRNAVEADLAGRFSAEHVALFGVVGSLVLLVGYLPLRLELYRRGERAIAEACQEAPKTPEGLKHWADTRAAMETLLGHDSKNLFGLSGVLSSLLPLVLGSIGRLLAN